MRDTLLIIQTVISITLIITILLQKRGAGLGGAFGGGGGGGTYYQKRGVEKILFYISVIFSVLFLGLGFVILVLL